MKVVVNALPLCGLETGIGRYVRSLYTALEDLGLEVWYFTGRLRRTMPRPARVERWTRRTDLLWQLPWPAVVMLRIVFWWRFERRLQRALRGCSDVLYHETTFFPAAGPRPQVFTLYDLSLLLRPQDHPRERVAFARLFLRRRLPLADHVIAISSFVRTEALTHLGLPAEKVSAIPLAPAPHFRPPGAKAREQVQARYHLPREYFLFVGTIDPRKNLSLVLRALARYPQAPPLVLVGWRGWGHKTLHQALERYGLRDRVRQLDYVPDQDLPALYAGACALLYPSLYEGFGLPVLEAMACGCPVICSRAASLPEVAGSAAWLVDPHEPEELLEAMKRVRQQEVRQELIQRGLERAKEFSWQKTARLTLEVFQKVMGT